MASVASSMVMPATRTRAVGRPQGDDPLAFDQEEAVDGLIEQRAQHADLQHVVDVDAVGGQRHQLEHLDLQDVGRLDAVGRQRDHGQFAGRLHAPAARAVAATAS